MGLFQSPSLSISLSIYFFFSFFFKIYFSHLRLMWGFGLCSISTAEPEGRRGISLCSQKVSLLSPWIAFVFELCSNWKILCMFVLNFEFCFWGYWVRKWIIRIEACFVIGISTWTEMYLCQSVRPEFGSSEENSAVALLASYVDPTGILDVWSEATKCIRKYFREGWMRKGWVHLWLNLGCFRIELWCDKVSY